MPHYFLHIHNGIGNARDEEGIELPGVPDARERAILGIRSIVAEEARDGKIDLAGRITICDADGEVLLEVPFREAFELQLGDD